MPVATGFVAGMFTTHNLHKSAGLIQSDGSPFRNTLPRVHASFANGHFAAMALTAPTCGVDELSALAVATLLRRLMIEEDRRLLLWTANGVLAGRYRFLDTALAARRAGEHLMPYEGLLATLLAHGSLAVRQYYRPRPGALARILAAEVKEPCVRYAYALVGKASVTVPAGLKLLQDDHMPKGVFVLVPEGRPLRVLYLYDYLALEYPWGPGNPPTVEVRSMTRLEVTGPEHFVVGVPMVEDPCAGCGTELPTDEAFYTDNVGRRICGACREKGESS